MENLKKFASSLIAFMMVATSTLSGLVHAQGALIDDPEFDSALEWMYSNGMTQYSTQEDFMPFNTLTREQAAKFYSEFAESELGLERDADAECDFEDLDESDPSLTNSIVKACEMGLIKGDGNEFLPKQEFTRAQAFTVLVRATVGDQSEDVNPWWANYFDVAQEEGYTVETDVYDQDRATQRYEVALMIYRASEDSEDTEADDGDDLGDLEDIIGGIIGDEDEGDTQDEDTQDEDTEDEDTEDEGTSEDEETEYDVEEGMVEVALNPSSPSDQSIPGTGRVTYATIDVAAGDSDVAVDSIELTREGLGTRSDINRVWFEQDNARVSSRQTISRDNTVDIRMDRDFVVQAGDVASLDLVVEMESGGDSGNEHSFVIESVDAIQADGEVVGNFPIRTATMRTSSYAVAELSVNPTVPDDIDEPMDTYYVGDTNVTLAEFEMENKSSDEEVELRRITMNQEWNADVAASLSDLGLYINDQEITKDVKVNGREVTFVIDRDSKYSTIADNSIEYVEVKADITGAERTEDYYQFEIRRGTDLYAVETRTQFAASLASDSIRAAKYNVDGGDLLIRRDTEYSASQDVAPGTNNVTLLSANMTVNNPIVVEDGMTFTGNFANNTDEDVSDYLYDVYSSLRLIVDGRTVATYTPNRSDEDSISFDSSFDIAEDANIKVEGNVRSNININCSDKNYTSGGDVCDDHDKNTKGKYDAVSLELESLSKDSFNTVRYISNDERAEDDMDGSSRGIRVTVEEASLQLSRRDTLSSEEVVPGSRDVKVYGLRIREEDVSDIRLTDLNLTGSISSNSGSITDSDIQNVRLYRDGELLATNSSNDFDFSSLNTTIEKNERANFELVVDFSTNIDADTGTDPAPTFKIDDTVSYRYRNLSSNSVEDKTETGLWGAEFTFAEASMDIAYSTNRPNKSILVPSSETELVHILEFEAENDDLTLTDLTFWSGGNNTLDFSNVLRNAELVIDGNTYDNFIDYENKIEFDSIDHVFQADEVTDVELRLSFNDSSDDRYGDLQLMLEKAEFESDSTGEELTLEPDMGNTESRTHLFARTYPVVAEAGSEDYDQTFEFTANENRRAHIESIQFEISGDSNAIWTGNGNGASSNNLSGAVEMEFNWSSITLTGGTKRNTDKDILTVVFDESQTISAGTTSDVKLMNLSNYINTDEIDDANIRVIGVKYSSDGDGGSWEIDDNDSDYDYSNVGIPTAYGSRDYDNGS